MLTAQEIHIEINQGFQKVASNVYDYFTTEEIDWIFNKNQSRFVSRCVKPRPDGSGAFQVDESSEQDIQNIIRRDRVITVNRIDPTRGYAFKPNDCDFIINDRSRVLTDCDKSFSTTTIPYTVYTSILEFPTSLRNSNCYENLIIRRNGIPIFNSSDYSLSSGLSTANQKFVLINLILEVLQKQVECYWESFNDKYHVNSFIFITEGDSDIFTLSMENETFLSESTSNIYNKYIDMYEKEVPNRLTKGSALYEVLNNNVYYKTNDKSPVTNLIENKIYIFNSERFIVPMLVLDYVRNPRKINLSLDRSSELSENAIRKVCDLSVEYMKNIIESPNYRMKQEDNLIRLE